MSEEVASDDEIEVNSNDLDSIDNKNYMQLENKCEGKEKESNQSDDEVVQKRVKRRYKTRVNKKEAKEKEEPVVKKKRGRPRKI